MKIAGCEGIAIDRVLGSSKRFDDFADMLAKNPTAYFNNVDGCFYKDGYSGNYLVITKIGECSQSYDAGEDDIDTQDVEIPEMIP